jgi:hypothetical protein
MDRFCCLVILPSTSSQPVAKPNELGFEIGNHTLWHASLGKYDPPTVTDASASLDLTNDSGNPLTVTIGGLGSGSNFNVALPAGATHILQTEVLT